MVLACVGVAGAMAAILTWFFRRLARIEQQIWGDGAGKQKTAAKR
jgi:hypothetical protein